MARGHNALALRLREFFKTGAAFGMNVQVRLDLEPPGSRRADAL